jgi:6,7-dimethyl-8-ribityllumazine synthase
MAVTPEKLNDISGIRLPADACVVIVRTEWNSEIVDKLEAGCTSILMQHRVSYKIISVPGAFEIGFAIRNYWQESNAPKPYAFIALGCILKGETPHFEFISSAVTEALSQLNLTLPVPVIFGVLTVNYELQALERTGGVHGHKGEEAAITSLKMIALAQSFKNNS